MIRPSRTAFIKDEPFISLPSPNGFFIPFHGFAGRSLATPSKMAKDSPDVAGMVGDTTGIADGVCHAREGPQAVAVPAGFRTFKQDSPDPSPLFFIESGSSPGATGRSQSGDAMLLECLCPPGYGHLAGAHLAGHRCLAAYDCDELDRELRKEGIEMIAPHRMNRRKDATQDGRMLRRYQRRWIVERFFAWLQWHRRILIRWEFHPTNFLGFVQLASILILLKQF